MDGNIADNPVHETVPDKLVGPMQVTQLRRSKYIAVSRLTDDYLGVTGSIRTFEGNMEGDNDLIALRKAGALQWTKWDAKAPPRPPGSTEDGSGSGYLGDAWVELGPGRVKTTQPLRVYGDMGPFNFQTASDWFCRFCQYYDDYNDRRNSPVNFKNEITDGQV